MTTTHAEGVTWNNAAWNVLRFSSDVFTSLARLADDFRQDIANSNRRRIESEQFVSSVEAGFERLYAGDFPELEEVLAGDDDEYDVEGEGYG